MNPYLAWGTLVAITWLTFTAGYLVGRLTTRIHRRRDQPTVRNVT